MPYISRKLPLQARKEIYQLYTLGINIDEIKYLVKTKFNKNIMMKELIDYLFYSV